MIPDDVTDGFFKLLFGSSEPGQTFHHLLLAMAKPEDRTALGFPLADKLEVSVFAIMPDGAVDTDQCIAQTIMAATVEAAEQRRMVIHFAGLAVEAFTVLDDGTEVTENLARRLEADRKMEERPHAVEVTRLYAACRDGRRWAGLHVLTGPTAGAIFGPTMREGPLAPYESGLHQRLVRAAAGLGKTR